MSKRDFARFAFATLLVAFSVFALLSLANYNRYDPCGGLEDYTSSTSPIRNYCGLPGAYLAGILHSTFGRTAYLLVFLCAAWGIEIFARARIKHLPLRIIGGLLLLLAGVALAAMFGELGLGHSSVYEGGIVGKILWDALAKSLPTARACIVLLLVIAASLMMITDLRIIAWLGRLTAFVWRILQWLFYRPTRTTTELPLSEPQAPAIPSTPMQRQQPQPTGSTVLPPRPPDTAPPRPNPSPPASNRVEPPRPPIIINANTRPEGPKIVGLPTQPECPPRSEPAKSHPETHLWGKDYKFPPISLLEKSTPLDLSQQEGTIRANAVILENTLKEFNIQAQVVEIQRGPVITQYELSLAPGIKVGRIIGLSDDIAMALKAPSVRVVAPIPGKSTVGVEVPNALRDTVRMRELLEIYYATAHKRVTLPLMLGKDAAGNPLISDLSAMPHLLIAGATGSGKSVCINAAILSILMTQHPDNVKLLLVDPKMVELACFKEVPHLMCPVVSDMKKAAAILEWACRKMDERYELLARTQVRNIGMYNDLGEDEIRRRLTQEEADVNLDDVPLHMPYVVIVVDELADLMMTAAKEVERSVTRLSQKSRAVGIHIILATQRPSVDVVTGLIKANMPSRIAFHMSSKVDSRTILDQNGAEKLLGMGDMLFLPPGSSKLIRAQGTLVTENEIRAVVDFLRQQCSPRFSDELIKHSALVTSVSDGEERDELYREAVRIVLENQRGSVSLLQRKLEIGYSRAARLIDLMAEDGIVGEYKGSQARECLITLEQWEAMQAQKEKAV